MTQRFDHRSHHLGDLGLGEEATEKVMALIDRSADPLGASERVVPVLAANPNLATDPEMLEKVVAIVATSRSLASTLTQHPRLLYGEAPSGSMGLRLRAALVEVAALDLTGQIRMDEATARLSDSVDELVEEALLVSVESLASRHPLVETVPFAVIAMGKWGARELNYHSDIDMVLVHESVEGHENESRATALALASRLVSVLSSPSSDGPGVNVDLDLRPEGTMGPLTRSLDSYEGYYRRWGEAWELQALLKARPAAGDLELGARFRRLADRIVWEEGLDAEALRSIRRLKAQAEESAPASDLKRSRGGIRDVEFAIQLLQLVHGRFDPDLRVTSTLAAIAALGAHDYLEDPEADRLATSYRFLRDLEHRIQLWDLRQTHELPKDRTDRERLGRSLGFTHDPASELETRLAEVRSEVRDLHERLYFRPILDSLVGVPSARIGTKDAERRLDALGFQDLVAATRALEDLTSGLSRRSRVMHQALPLMLDWLSRSPDPDLGLAQLRILLANTPDHANLVTLLQNNPLAGERLCLLLGTGRLLGELMDRIPEFIPRLADDSLLNDIRPLDEERQRLVGLIESRSDDEARVGTIRRFVRRRKLRIAARDILSAPPPDETLRALSDTADAAIDAALRVVGDGEVPGHFGVVAMGRWGGRELSYGSDIDLIYIFDVEENRNRALEIAGALRRVLSEPNRHGVAFELDTDLRPEGRQGPLARSIESYRRYYQEWAQAWELLALVKARPVAGDPDVLEEFTSLTTPVVWREHLPTETIREIRAMKARVETERIPPGEDPDFHLKLGPGGLSDVEFLVQLLQLKHAGTHPDLRATSTFDALRLLESTGIIGTADFEALYDSYLFCTRARLRLHLQSGAPSDSLPIDPIAKSRLAVSLGFARAGELREHYKRVTRRARRVFERLFFD